MAKLSKQDALIYNLIARFEIALDDRLTINQIEQAVKDALSILAACEKPQKRRA